jgi:hypothetical protein
MILVSAFFVTRSIDLKEPLRGQLPFATGCAQWGFS